jgi:hypothetical protein
MVTITADLTARVCIITFIYSIISYLVVEKYVTSPNQLSFYIPLLSVAFGVVILISVLFDLRTYHVWNAKK